MSNIHHKYTGEIQERAVSAVHLSKRLDINEQNQTIDLVEWLFNEISFSQGSNVLDVGCGNGKQTIPFAQKVGPSGNVFAFDISEDSVKILKEKAKAENLDNVNAIVGDMYDLKAIIDKTFSKHSFDVIHSSYALYYVDDHMKALNELYDYLDNDGQMIIFTPCEPHGMVQFVEKFHPVPVQIAECFAFGNDLLLPFFRDHFKTLTVSYYDNLLSLKNVDDFMSLYKASTYFNADFTDEIQAAVQKIIEEKGQIEMPKTGFLIQGKGKRDKDRTQEGNAF